MLLSLFGSGLLAAGLGFAPNLQAFVTLLLGFGFLADLFQPAAAAIVTDLVPPDQRKVGFAGLRLAVNLGFAAGVVVGGFLVDWDWRFLFWGDGLSTLAYGVVILLFIGGGTLVSAVSHRVEQAATKRAQSSAVSMVGQITP